MSLRGSFLIAQNAVFCIGVFIGSAFASADTTTPAIFPLDKPRPHIIRIPHFGEENRQDTNYFYVGLLKLALTNTQDTHGPFELVQLEHHMGTERMRLMLEQGTDMDVIWSTSNTEREARFLAVEVNLLRGLNEYRALLVTDEGVEKFKGVQSLEQLRSIRVGSGDHWQDTIVLKHNALPVVGFWDYETMIPMLKGKRFDYISRGMHEVWRETRYNEGVTIVPNVILHYRLPVHYFVKKGNTALADRIEQGLVKAIEDGSYYDLFYAVPSHRKGFDWLKEMDPVIVELENPAAKYKPDMIIP